jgi:RNase P subunit RPR2
MLKFCQSCQKLWPYTEGKWRDVLRSNGKAFYTMCPHCAQARDFARANKRMKTGGDQNDSNSMLDRAWVHPNVHQNGRHYQTQEDV